MSDTLIYFDEIFPVNNDVYDRLIYTPLSKLSIISTKQHICYFWKNQHSTYNNYRGNQ